VGGVGTVVVYLDHAAEDTAVFEQIFARMQRLHVMTIDVDFEEIDLGQGEFSDPFIEGGRLGRFDEFLRGPYVDLAKFLIGFDEII
jgi:hypothetical protein